MIECNLHCIHKLGYHILRIHQCNQCGMDKLKTLMMLSCLRIDNTYIAFEIIKKIATYSQYKQWILCYSRKGIQVLRMLMNIPYILHDILMNISLPKAGH